MDPIRPITPRELDVERVWRVDRTERDAQERREEQQSRERRRDPHEEPPATPAAAPPDDDEPPHLIDVIA